MMYSLITLLILALTVVRGLTEPLVCSGDGDCGWNSYCDHGQCWCRSGYQRGAASNHCLDRTCHVANCVQCLDDKSCRRCAGYLLAGSGRCVDTCSTEYTLLVIGEEVGRVCQGEASGLSMVYVSVIIATVSAVLLVVLLALAIHYKIRTDKERDKRLKLMGEIHHNEKKTKAVQGATKIMDWDYYSYGSSEEEFRLKHLHYYHQVAALRPSMDMFLAMLRDAKLKCRTLAPTDSRQLLYSNLIHQLCRVLTVINDRMAPLPTDGNLLLDWANRVLHDYKRYQKPMVPPSSESAGSCWTLPNGFSHHRHVMNGSLPSSRVNHVGHVHHTRSASQPLEADCELAEIAAVHLEDGLTDPIEV